MTRTRRPVREKGDFLVFDAPHIERDEIDEVVASMEAGWLGAGPKVARFGATFVPTAAAQAAAEEELGKPPSR